MVCGNIAIETNLRDLLRTTSFMATLKNIFKHYPSSALSNECFISMINYSGKKMPQNEVNIFMEIIQHVLDNRDYEFKIE